MIIIIQRALKKGGIKVGELQEKTIDIEVVKRNGKKVEFNGAKIALAIKKGFDSIKEEDEETPKYTENDENYDEAKMLNEAIKIAIDTGRMSASLLQTKLSWGYARAARIINKMEKMGIIGPFEGAKPRKVLMTREEFAEMIGDE